MKAYLISLIATALAVAMVSILTPEGEKGGIAKHVRLLTSLLLITALISPVVGLIDGMRALAEGNLELPWEENAPQEDYSEQLQGALDTASTTYFTDRLTQTVEEQFEISAGEVRCAVQWEAVDGKLAPARVTVILSGSAIWKDPAEIEAFVSTLLGCECVSAIE